MTEEPKPLRLWPGVAAVVLQWFAWFLIPVVVPDWVLWGMLAGFVCALIVLSWWLFFSRARWFERLGALVLIAVVPVLTKPLLHESIAGGMMGFMFFIYLIPVLSLALVAWAVVTRQRSDRWRRLSLVAVIALACGSFALLRTHGVTGYGSSDLAWRWSASPEERLLARGAVAPTGAASALPVAADARPVWSGFRGPARDGIARGERIATDWAASPPVELWRRPIGPGWSSFAVSHDRLYTQEQRGEEEVVACHDLATGGPVWRHADPVRFWESNAGAGPRATPALDAGRLYALGATGILNALDAATGATIWSRDAAADTGKEAPGWGFSGSPLVVDGLVVVALGGKLVAYDALTGEPRWTGPDGGTDYSSPHLVTIDGVAQIVLLAAPGVTSVAPADGQVLWEHELPAHTRIVQPALVEDGEILVADGDATGLRRITVRSGPDGWTVDERWKSIGLKPYFNDFVVHEGHAYGFDGNILACVDLVDGKRKWKGGRYGNGQLVLLPEQDLLLVLSEKGELALVSATPGGFRELARRDGIHGKTWNHPVLVDGVLLARNGEEMAAFRLAPP